MCVRVCECVCACARVSVCVHACVCERARACVCRECTCARACVFVLNFYVTVKLLVYFNLIKINLVRVCFKLLQ